MVINSVLQFIDYVSAVAPAYLSSHLARSRRLLPKPIKLRAAKPLEAKDKTAA